MTWRAGRLRWFSALVVACAACPASAAAAPTVTEFTGGVTPGFSANRGPFGITVGPDGNIWFTEVGGGDVARLNANGSVTEFVLTSEGHPAAIAAGPDGNLWFTEPAPDNRVGRLNPSNGTITELSSPGTPGFSANANPGEITEGRDGNVWFTEFSAQRLARVNSNDTVTEFPSGVTPGFSSDRIPAGITVGPDGNIWFTEIGRFGGPGGVARFNPNHTVTEYSSGSTSGMSNGGFNGITAGPNGNIWYTRETDHPGVGRLNPDGTATEFTYGVTPGFSSSFTAGITMGCDGNIWFSDGGSTGGVGRVNPDDTITEYPGGTTPGLSANAYAYHLTSGPDGNIWFAEPGNPGRIARLTPPAGTDTGPASGVGRHVATLGGAVRPCGQPTFYSFEYGTSIGYGNATAPVGVPGTMSAIPVSAPVARLLPDTVYHYRLVTTNKSGTTNGADHTFRTSPNLLVTLLGAFPAVFVAESSGPSAVITKKRHLGTTVRFTLHEAGKVRFTVTKQASGRTVKRGKQRVCVRPTRKNRSHKQCKRQVTLKGSFNINGIKGKNRFHFTGRLHGKKLPPGRYRLVATPIIGGVAAKPTSTVFQIVR